MNYSHVRRAAFTLVEMAIVLVIIGLLVGGIFATRSYIRSAELTTMMSESKYYMNALNQFQAQYKTLPGDMDNAVSYWSAAGGSSSDNYTTSCYNHPNPRATCNGDGNGLISSGTPSNAYEDFLLIQHLALAGMITGSYTGMGDGGVLNATPGKNSPRGVITGTTYLIYHMSSSDGNVSGSTIPFDGLYNNVLLVAAANVPQTGGVPNTPFMTPSEAQQLDKKFDDGLPGSGWILTPKSSYLPNCATTDVVSTAVYNTSYGNKSCYFLIKIP